MHFKPKETYISYTQIKLLEGRGVHMRSASFFVLKSFASGELAAFIDSETPPIQEAVRQVEEGNGLCAHIRFRYPFLWLYVYIVVCVCVHTSVLLCGLIGRGTLKGQYKINKEFFELQIMQSYSSGVPE